MTLPRAGNLGGGGFMLIYLKDQNEILAIDYRGQSPSELKADQIFGLELPRNIRMQIETLFGMDIEPQLFQVQSQGYCLLMLSSESYHSRRS